MQDTISARLLRNVKPYAISSTGRTWSFRWRTGFKLRLTIPPWLTRETLHRFDIVFYVLSLAILGMMASSLMEGLGK